MPVVHIGIGSNLGNRQDNCLEAIKRIQQQGVDVSKQSSMIETFPWGLKDQPDFINMAIEAETDLSPEELLNLLKTTEIVMGREEGRRWGPRIIDLDLLFYDDLIIDSEELKIPHPYLHERDFVMRPLMEIAPEKLHPVLNKTIYELMR